MRCYVAWLRSKIVGTVEAPSDLEAACLVVTMWGSETQVRRSNEVPWAVYAAMGKDEVANSLGREAEIMFKIGRE